MISYIRKQVTAQKRKNKNTEHALEAPRDEAEEYLLALESSEKLRRIVDNDLTDYERSVFRLYIQKKSYTEIGEALGRDAKSVGNAVYRVKRKIKKLYMPE